MSRREHFNKIMMSMKVAINLNVFRTLVTREIIGTLYVNPTVTILGVALAIILNVNKQSKPSYLGRGVWPCHVPFNT